MYKILIIDSITESLELVSRRLTSLNYDVITADTGISGFTKSKLFAPDLVIISTELSDVNSFEICRKIKESEETKDVLVLFTSNLETREASIKAFEANADDFIEKNSSSFVFLAKVKSLLRVKNLANQLSKKYIELEEKDKILAYQMKMGRQVQRSLIKDFNFTLNNVIFSSKYMPALDIGGDFYDVVRLDNGCVGVMIGDVSGHGISAALLTSMLTMMFKNLTTSYSEPNVILSYMNEQFCQIFKNSSSEMYASVFCAVIDTLGEKIYYSNAGHTLPIFFSNDEKIVFELENFGLPIGIMDGTAYSYSILDYKNNDMLLFYTDGLSDTYYKNSPDDFFARIKDLLLDNVSAKNPSEMINVLLNVFYNMGAK